MTRRWRSPSRPLGYRCRPDRPLPGRLRLEPEPVRSRSSDHQQLTAASPKKRPSPNPSRSPPIAGVERTSRGPEDWRHGDNGEAASCGTRSFGLLCSDSWLHRSRRSRPPLRPVFPSPRQPTRPRRSINRSRVSTTWAISRAICPLSLRHWVFRGSSLSLCFGERSG